MKKIQLFCGFLLLLTACQNEVKEELSVEEKRVRESILLQKELFHTPGIAFGMIVHDTLVIAEAQGVKSLDTQEPLTTKSLFHMASVSKPFVATAIAQLIEQGKMELEGKLTDYLPYFTMDDDRYKDITIKQMLTHTSGIPNTNEYEWDKPQFDEGAAERYARAHRSLKLDFTPGSRYKYSNPAFDILCDVIAKVSGMPFEEYMRVHIFEPSGMKNSSFFRPDPDNPLATSPHVYGDSLQRMVSDIYPYNRRHAGSSTLHSNVEDLLRWARVYLNKGSIDSVRIFSEETYDLITALHTPEDMRKSALSWSIGQINEQPIYNHSGGDTGYRTFFGFMPEQKSAVFIMGNSDNFWSTNNAATLLRNFVFNDTLRIKAPIHFKLKDHILTEGIGKVREVYHEEKQKPHSNYSFDGGDLDDFGYWLIDLGYHQLALEVFLFNTELEPEHAGWVDSVGDAYRAMDSTNLAIEWYTKALNMKPDQKFSQRKLEEIMDEVLLKAANE